MTPAASSRCWAVVPAAGIGSRMGGELPKQYVELAGATILEHSLLVLLASERVEGVVVVLHPEDRWAAHMGIIDDPRVHTTVGGAQRSDSVLSGLAALAETADERGWVLVHDAARPCLAARDLEKLMDTVIDSGIGGILAEPVVDTIKLSDGAGRVLRTLERAQLWRAQTPQMFRLAELREALQLASQQGVAVTDEASAMELAGKPVQLVAGASSNLKVTLPADLELAAWYLGRLGKA